MRQFSIVSIMALGVLAGLGPASAQSDEREAPRNPNARPGTVSANGRCNGVSYGTGARSCGTRTGGPVGGISGRN